jgi:hypothetical protein
VFFTSPMPISGRGGTLHRARPAGVPVLDAAVAALENALGQHPKAQPGSQHIMDEAYFKRSRNQFTSPMMTASAGKTGKRRILSWPEFRAPRRRRPRSISPIAAKVANIPVVVESPPPAAPA